MNLPSWITGRLNTRAFSFLLAIILSLAGIWMIFLGIKDDGFIDIKSALIEGRVKVGLVGVLLIFLGAFLASIATLSKSGWHHIKFESGEIKIEWNGPYSQEDALSVIKSLSETLKKIHQESHSNRM